MSNMPMYMGQTPELCTLSNGAVTNAESQRKLARTMYLEPTTDKVAPGITVFGGHGILNLTLIEGDDGLIVFDTGEVLADGVRFLKQIREISQKPIVAVVYSHSHYVHGTQALLADGLSDEKELVIIGHPSVNRNLAGAATGNTYGETGPLQTARLMQQFGNFVESSGANASAGAYIQIGKSGLLPVNLAVENSQCVTISGVKMQFFTEHGADSDDCLTMYLPDKGVVLNNFLWPYIPNVYTLRAAKFRDPRDWRDGLQVILDLSPSVLVNTHARALIGKQTVRDTIEHVIDALNFVLDQSLRGMLHGLSAEQLREFVQPTKALAEHPNIAEIYGEISHFGPYLFNHALGWFDGDAANINPLPPAEQAQRLVQAMGGRHSVLEQAKAAQIKKEHAWALQLLQYLYVLTPDNVDVRRRKADSLEYLGQVTPAHTVRNWYMTQARALRGEVTVPRLQFAGPRTLAMSEPAVSMDQYRVRINPQLAGDRELFVLLRIRDKEGVQHGWKMRRGVAAFVEHTAHASSLDSLLECSFETWLLFFTCRIELSEFLSQSTLLDGSITKAREFFECFDFFDPKKNDALTAFNPLE